MLLFIALIVVAIAVYLNRHATDRHGDEANQARNCIRNNGVWQVYKEPGNNIHHWLCKDPVTGTIFDLIVEKINEMTYKEKTAFRPKDGKWDAVRYWLEGKRGGTWQNPPTGPIELIQP